MSGMEALGQLPAVGRHQSLSEGLAEHPLVVRQIGHQFLQSAVVVLNPAEHTHRILPTNVGDRRPAVGLRPRECILLFGELGALHNFLLTGTEDHEANLLQF